MTKAKKSLALVLVIVLALSLFPMTAFAAADTLANTTTIKGIALSNGTIGTAIAGDATGGTTWAPSGELTLTWAQANGTGTTVAAFTGNTNNKKIVKVAFENVAAINTNAKLQAAVGAAATPGTNGELVTSGATTFADGDLVIFADAGDSSDTYGATNTRIYAIVVTVNPSLVEPTSLGVRGVTKISGWGDPIPESSKTNVSTFAKGEIALSTAAAAKAEAPVLALATGTSGKVYRVAAGSIGNDITAMTTELGTTAIELGDWLIIAIDSEHGSWTANDTYYILEVTSITATAGDIIGDSTVEFPVLQVVVPANLNFALDPLQQDVIDTNQIAKADYVVVNQTTAAPVQVNFVVVARAKAGVGLVETAEEIDALNPAETAKNIYFGMLAAASASTVPAYAGTGGAYVYDATSVASGSPQVVPFPAASATPISEATAKISFVLEKAVDGSTLAAAGKGAGAFQFYGNLNTYATWEDNDLTVRATYKLVALPANAYASLPKAGLNQYVETPAEAPPPGVHIALKANAVTVPTLTVSRAAFSAKTGAYSGKTGIEIYLYGKPDTDDILNITRGDTDQLFPTSAWTYDGDTGILLVTALPSSGSKIDWTINVKHEADPAYTYEMIISLVS